MGTFAGLKWRLTLLQFSNILGAGNLGLDEVEDCLSYAVIIMPIVT